MATAAEGSEAVARAEAETAAAAREEATEAAATEVAATEVAAPDDDGPPSRAGQRPSGPAAELPQSCAMRRNLSVRTMHTRREQH